MSKLEMIVRPFYTCGQIGKMIHYTTKGARGFLYRLNIPIHYVGNRNIVFLSDLQSYAPELYASILEANNLNSIIQKNKEIDDEDFICQDQFTK